MKRDDMTTGSDRAARAGGAVVAHFVSSDAMRRTPGAMVRVLRIYD